MEIVKQIDGKNYVEVFTFDELPKEVQKSIYNKDIYRFLNEDWYETDKEDFLEMFYSTGIDVQIDSLHFDLERNKLEYNLNIDIEKLIDAYEGENSELYTYLADKDIEGLENKELIRMLIDRQLIHYTAEVNCRFVDYFNINIEDYKKDANEKELPLIDKALYSLYKWLKELILTLNNTLFANLQYSYDYETSYDYVAEMYDLYTYYFTANGKEV